VYALNALPGPAAFVNRITTASDREGQGTGNKALAYLGVRATQVDPVSTMIETLYEQRTKVNRAKNALHQRANPNGSGLISAANPTPEYLRLNKQYADMTKEIMKLREKRGDKILPGRRPSRSGGVDFGSGGGGVDWGSSGSGVTW
jgi:hypothetical protein